MQATSYQGDALHCIIVDPDDYDPAKAYPVCVVLHGFGANMYDLVSISPAISRADYVFIYPNAPFSIDLGGGQTGFSWSANMPGQPPVAGENTAELRLTTFLEGIAEQRPLIPGRVLLAGFSQGGGLALRYGLPRADLFAGIAVLSGAFRETPELVKQLPAERTQPIFVAHGQLDPMVTIDRGQSTKAYLEQLGYAPIYREYPIAHEISDEELADLSAFVADVLPAG